MKICSVAVGVDTAVNQVDGWGLQVLEAAGRHHNSGVRSNQSVVLSLELVVLDRSSSPSPGSVCSPCSMLVEVTRADGVETFCLFGSWVTPGGHCEA